MIEDVKIWTLAILIEDYLKRYQVKYNIVHLLIQYYL